MRSPYLKLRFFDIVFIAVFISALASGSQMLAIDSDLGRHLVLGNIILDERIIPTHDLLSHTRTGLSRPPYEWLSQVLFALVYRLLGLDGVILLTALTIAITFSLLYEIAFRRSRSSIIALIIVLLSAGASSLHWLPRPHIFTFLFLVVWTELLDSLTRSNEPPKYYAFSLTMLIWANMHGGFIFGILVWIAYTTGWIWNMRNKTSAKRSGKKLMIAGLVSIPATIITPGLWRNWEAVLNNRSAFILNRTIETMRPNLIDESVLPFTILLMVTTLLIASTWRKIKPSQLFLLLGFGVLALFMIRNIPLFVITSAPILSEFGANTLSKFNQWNKTEKRFSGFNLTPERSIWAITAALATITYITYQNSKINHSMHQFNPNVFPVNAANFVHANTLDGNMFNQFNWGGYLLYRLWPEQQVFIDGQTDFYGETLSREYVQVESLHPGWEDVLSKYNVSWVITQKDQPLEDALLENDWEVLYEDNTAVILRKPQANALQTK